jgi:hypothetical protein
MPVNVLPSSVSDKRQLIRCHSNYFSILFMQSFDQNCSIPLQCVILKVKMCECGESWTRKFGERVKVDSIYGK